MGAFYENDVVRVKADHPSEGVKAGDLGAVICVFDSPSEAYDVEFVDGEGRTRATLTLEPDELETAPGEVAYGNVAEMDALSMGRIATPLGSVGLWLDGEPCAHDGMWEVFDRSDYALRHHVDGNVRIAYWHEPDGSDHVLECRLEPLNACEGCGAPGERLEATEIRDGHSELVIAVEYDCEEHAQGHGEHEYDYRASADGLAATVSLPADAKAQWIVFGISWVDEETEENETNPWLLGDPICDRLRLPVGVYKKDGSGPYGGRTIEWFIPIERPWERKDDVLALFDGCEVVEHACGDEGYENLEDIESIVEIAKPDCLADVWLGFGGEYTFGRDGTHCHYFAYEGDYRELKSDIRALLADRLSGLEQQA